MPSLSGANPLLSLGPSGVAYEGLSPPPRSPPPRLHEPGRGPRRAAYDLVIRGGQILDGSGQPASRAMSPSRADRIAYIGRTRGRGAREIDAKGKAVSPASSTCSPVQQSLIADGPGSRS